MVEKIILYAFIFFVLYFLGFNFHEFILINSSSYVDFSLQKVYLLLSVLSFLICLVLEFLSAKEIFFNQLGFIYIGTIVFKLTFFSVVFSELLFSELVITKADKVSMLFPFFVYLFVEVIFISKTLNKKSVKN